MGSRGHSSDRQDLLPAVRRASETGAFRLDTFGSAGLPLVHPMWLLKGLANNVLYFLSSKFNAQGMNNNISMGAVAGTMAIGEAFHTIQHGYVDVAFAGGYDSALDPDRIEMFRRSGLMTKSSDPARASRPFDRCRDGFLPAEGASFLVLETVESARRRGARMYGELLGYGSAGPAGCVNGLGPSERGFAGALTAGWRAYNISADKASGLGDWTDEDLATYLSTGHADSHGGSAGPMGEATDNSLTFLTPGDIHALVVYLRSVPSRQTDLPRRVDVPAPASYREGATAALDPRGAIIFASACASCHDWTGVSPTSKYATLTGVRAVNDPSATNVAQTVINGVIRKTAEGMIFMPAFGDGYSDADIAVVSNYVTARFGAEGGHLTEKDIVSLRKQAAQL